MTPHLYLGPSRIAGTGVHAGQYIARGTCLGVAHRLDGDAWSTTTLGAFHNHSTRPTAVNIRRGPNRYLYAARNLRPHEEITVDYRLQPDLEQPKASWR